MIDIERAASIKNIQKATNFSGKNLTCPVNFSKSAAVLNLFGNLRTNLFDQHYDYVISYKKARFIMSEKSSIAAIPAQPGPANGDAISGVPGQSESKSLLSEHKGKLAIGVAATLGIMVFYNWREKRLAKEDPEGYARLQRLKASVRTDEADAKHKENKKPLHVPDSSEQPPESGYGIQKQ